MDWTAIKTEYVTTAVSLRALAKKYGIRPHTLYDRSKREGWVTLREQNRLKSDTKLVEQTSDLVASARADLYEAAQAMIAELKELVTDRGDLKPREITSAMKDCMDILGLKSDDDLAEQRARIDKLRREAAGETQDREITVRFEKMESESWGN